MREKDTLVYSREAYTEDTRFKNIIEDTLDDANNIKEHVKLVQSYYENYTIEPLFKSKYKTPSLQRFKKKKKRSFIDGMIAYKKEEQVDAKIEKINSELK